MITPRFDLRQDEEFLYIDIKALNIKVQDVEIHAEGDLFLFSLSPYYLRLTLPGRVIEDERSHASCDISLGLIIVKLAKETKGEHFADLDLTSRLLVRKETPQQTQPQKSKPLIENLQLSARYGFNYQYSGLFTQNVLSGNEINEIDSVEQSTIESRSLERKEKEDKKFDQEYYLADFVSSDDIKEYIKCKSKPWLELRAWQKDHKFQEDDNKEELPRIEFTEKEKDELMKLPRKEYLIDNLKGTYLCLIPLIFGYCYDSRTTHGEPTSESTWTIGKLSPTISCLDSYFSTLADVIYACTRRALAYPLYRHWELIEKVWQDVYCSFRLGKRTLLRILLVIRERFAWHDTCYIYNRAIIDDYCVWIQSSSENVIRSLAHEIHAFKLEKRDIGWELEEVESLANDLPRETS
ncbi:Protein shq1 [Neolecta irregularis DAH-3]|uniref:Protein shq1 n=1 Tax=Neolecta irregularis (strain DAH-3) TaxID=1198029 RepID=A0A1U7LKA0_NEOID|nr:Protein shq1 [Neolecta irregularis DAH-3]|eukprot:OLL23085.1 Protein shq1 [Neolecta irregularis DAH-3]